jgi:hypothetical protein
MPKFVPREVHPLEQPTGLSDGDRKDVVVLDACAVALAFQIGGGSPLIVASADRNWKCEFCPDSMPPENVVVVYDCRKE